MVRVLVGKTIVEQDGPALERLRADYARVVMDVGTGDGRFVLRGARDDSDALHIGIDAVGDNMVATAQKARKKPGKGGAPNAMFVVSAIEQLPEVFDGWADALHVGYPWGSLLRAFVAPDRDVLDRIVRLAKPGGAIFVRLNQSVFDDAEYMTRLELPPFDPSRLGEALVDVGFEVQSAEVLAGDSGERTTWERRLVAGSHRRTYAIKGVRAEARSTAV
ncbi:MAG: methyltransferase domain-containing protein [Deltaproteobacteria bacterium]